MSRFRVKSIPVPSWCNNSEGEKIIKAFNSQPEPLYLSMYDDNITSKNQLSDELEQGMYDLVYPDCKEAERLKVLVEDGANVARYLGFSLTDLEIKKGALKANENWNLLEIKQDGDCRVLKISDYHILHNPKNPCTPYCAAYGYDMSTNEWAQGHYFITLTGALEYAIINSSDGDN